MDFEDWVAAVFDDSVEDPFPPPAEDLAHLTRLFGDPGAALEGLTDEEIGIGLWSVLDSGGAGTALALGDGSLPLEERIACIRLIPGVYRDLFVPRCEERLGHVGEQVGRLEMICYMFWDVAVIGGAPGTREGNLIEDAALDVLERIARMPHAACQESAIHGLGHRVRRHPERGPQALERWLRLDVARDPRLLDYARYARSGCIQ